MASTEIIKFFLLYFINLMKYIILKFKLNLCCWNKRSIVAMHFPFFNVLTHIGLPTIDLGFSISLIKRKKMAYYFIFLIFLLDFDIQFMSAS